MRRVIILGSSGSIGAQALDVIRANRDRFEVVGLSVGSQADVLAQQAAEFGVTATAVGHSDAEALVRNIDADVVLNGITGSVGLGPTLAALETNKTLALANKESLIMGGSLVTSLAKPGQIVPVDSEHSALAQALRGIDLGDDARLEIDARRQVQVGVRRPREAVDAAVLAAAIGVDRQVEAEVRRVVLGEDRLDAFFDDLRLQRHDLFRGLLVAPEQEIQR